MTKIEKIGDNFRLIQNGQQIGKSHKDFQKVICEINYHKLRIEDLGLIPENYHYLIHKQEPKRFCDIVQKMIRSEQILLTSGFTNPALIS